MHGVGNGTYGDPVTFATAAGGDFQDCEIIYLPHFRKYARYEKDCDQCRKFSRIARQIDLRLVGLGADPRG